VRKKNREVWNRIKGSANVLSQKKTKEVLESSVADPHNFDVIRNLLFTLIWIRILPFTLMRIRILTFQFDADPDPDPTTHFFPDLDPPK
jgi:hypothetical protein